MLFRIIEHDDFVEFVATGQVSEQELLGSIHSHARGRSDLRELWNFTAADVTEMDARRFRNMAPAAVSMGDGRPEGARTALLMGNREEMLLAKAFAGWSDLNSNRPMQAFHDRDAAIGWLLDDG